MKFSKRVFHALATVAWADGEVSSAEAAAILRAAGHSGLGDADLRDLRAALDSPRSFGGTLGPLDSLALSAEDREIVYALAFWVARLDGIVFASEAAAVERVGDRLLLGEAERVRARAASEGWARIVMDRSAPPATTTTTPA